MGILWRANLDGSSPVQLITGLGDMHGVGVNPIPPATTGACCTPDGGCFPMLGIDCAAAAGTFHGEGVLCSDISCPTVDGGTGATQESVDAIEAKLDADLDAPVSSRADQASVDALRLEVEAIEAKLDDGLDVPVSTRASDLSLAMLRGEVEAVEAKLDANLDVPVSSRAEQATVEAILVVLASCQEFPYFVGGVGADVLILLWWAD